MNVDNLCLAPIQPRGNREGVQLKSQSFLPHRRLSLQQSLTPVSHPGLAGTLQRLSLRIQLDRLPSDRTPPALNWATLHRPSTPAPALRPVAEGRGTCTWETLGRRLLKIRAAASQSHHPPPTLVSLCLLHQVAASLVVFPPQTWGACLLKTSICHSTQALLPHSPRARAHHLPKPSTLSAAWPRCHNSSRGRCQRPAPLQTQWAKVQTLALEAWATWSMA